MFSIHMRSRLLLRTALLAVAGLSLACADTNSADLVLRNGNIITVDDDNPSAQAIAVRDGRIVAWAVMRTSTGTSGREPR